MCVIGKLRVRVLGGKKKSGSGPRPADVTGFHTTLVRSKHPARSKHPVRSNRALRLLRLFLSGPPVSRFFCNQPSMDNDRAPPLTESFGVYVAVNAVRVMTFVEGLGNKTTPGELLRELSIGGYKGTLWYKERLLDPNAAIASAGVVDGSTLQLHVCPLEN